MSNNHLVFVYGSLRKDLHNHNSYLKHSKFLGRHTTHPEYTMLSLGSFPGVRVGGNTAIKGELYEVDDLALERLDYLEGVPTFYDRHTIPTEKGDAIMYVLERIGEYVEVPNGDWKDFIQSTGGFYNV